MPHSLPALPVPAWNTQATYSSIYTPGIHAIDPHSAIATAIHKAAEKVGFGPFALAPAMPTGLTGGAFPGLFRVGTDEMRPLNALRGISRLFTKRPEAIAPTGGPWLHNWAPQSPLGALLLPLVWVLGYIQSAFRNPSHLLLLVLWYAVYTTSTGGTGALIQALTVCFLCAAQFGAQFGALIRRAHSASCSHGPPARRPSDTSCSRTSTSGGPSGTRPHSSCGHS
jgi:hypothetical protein